MEYIDGLIGVDGNQLTGMDWEATGRKALDHRGTKRGFDEANAPPNFLLNFVAWQSDVNIQLEASNILLELPIAVQQQIGKYPESNRLLMMSSYLNGKLALLPTYNQVTVKEQATNMQKFQVLRKLLNVFSASKEFQDGTMANFEDL